MLSVHEVTTAYQGLVAISSVSIEVEKGEIFGLLGPNGAGKTTTLKVLSGLLHPTEGRVTVAGFTPRQRERGLMFRRSSI